MPDHIRALIFLLVLGLPAIHLARPMVRKLANDDEFRLWRAAWLFATCATFLSPSMLVYAALIAALGVYVFKKSANPYILYFVLLFCAPQSNVTVGLAGLFNSIMELNPARICAMVFLAPMAVRLWRKPGPSKLVAIDWLVAAFAALVVVLSMRVGSPTHTMRILALVLVDILLPYFVLSRGANTLADIRVILAALVFASLPFAASGVIEFTKAWRLYVPVMQSWDFVLLQPYLFRDGMLRAASTAVESIGFGFVCMAAFGALLANLKSSGRGLVAALAGCILLGLVASLSRGPWSGTALLLIVFAAASDRGLSNLTKLGLAGGLMCVAVLASPYADRVTSLLPFVGSVETFNEDYRSQLISVAMIIVARYPVFGSISYMNEPEMGALVQGQGIIDIVNSYIGVVFDYGLVGLALFLSIFVGVIGNLAKICFTTNSDTGLIRALMATLVAMMLTIATVSSVSFIPYLYWSFAGLGVAAFRLFRVVAEDEKPVDSTNGLTVLGRPPLFSPSRAFERAS